MLKRHRGRRFAWIRLRIATFGAHPARDWRGGYATNRGRELQNSMRGMGRIFKRGSVYWIAYSYRNKEYRESSGSESESQARKLLKKRIGEGSAGQFLGPNEERVT